jgi:murein DD-endopeptidase MepM/ murein hydrolase activator NlpD
VVRRGELELRLENERNSYVAARSALNEQIQELNEALREAKEDRDRARVQCERLDDDLRRARSQAEDERQRHLDEQQRLREERDQELRAAQERAAALEQALAQAEEALQDWTSRSSTEAPSNEDAHPAPGRTTEETAAASGPKDAPTAFKEQGRQRAHQLRAYTAPVDAPVSVGYHEPRGPGGERNTGIDFPVPAGTEVKAITVGRVVSAHWGGAYGYEVVLLHHDGRYSQYAQLASLSVQAGQTVRTGQCIGRSGSTGSSSSAHLHLEIRTESDAGSDIDPVPYLESKGVRVASGATPSRQAPAELAVAAQARRLRSHDPAERQAAVTELSSLMHGLPHTVPEIVGILSSYLRRTPDGDVPCPADDPVAAAVLRAVLDRPSEPGLTVDLAGVNLSRADLAGADLHGANLKGALLVNASLTGCNLSRADLTHADLRYTDLRGADLDGATGLRAASFTTALTDGRTVLPPELRALRRQHRPKPSAEPENPAIATFARRAKGPWDISEVPEQEPGEGRIDLGGLFVPWAEGMELRMEVAGEAVVAATVVLGDSALQLQGFAAPKREGIWGEVREELASGITQQGGIVDEVEGSLGWELRAEVPVQLPDGGDGYQIVRFVGVDGPRWFLRGVISGRAAVQPQTAGPLEQISRDTVVVRGKGPMAPRDPIVLRLPPGAQMESENFEQTNSPDQGGQAPQAVG